MAFEIERKFLTANEGWRDQVTSTTSLWQGYLNSEKARTVRVRIAGEKGYLTIKGPSVGIVRKEFEYEIPLADARELMTLCEQPIIEKTRYLVAQNGHVWEVDVFAGANEGLVVAELELDSEAETFVRPDWLGEEVSDDARYFNSSLIKLPFGEWGKGG